MLAKSVPRHFIKGQALTSRSEAVKKRMQEAADEEIDHLDWCFHRIEQLDSHTSYLNPVWYLGSFLLGVGAGIAGDKWSLGFLAETEHQVVEHLESHLGKLPPEDTVSRAVVEQMASDEAKHQTNGYRQWCCRITHPYQKLNAFQCAGDDHRRRKNLDYEPDG